MPTSNFLRPYCAAMEQYTDAPPIYHKACAYAGMGSLLTRTTHRCVLTVGIPNYWTNLYVVLLGESASDRKSTSISMIQEVINRVEPELVGPDDMSPEGLLAHLDARKYSTGGPSTILFQSEFLNLLTQMRRTYSQTLKPNLLAFHDVPPLFKRKLKSGVISIPQPRASMLGGITPEFLARYAAADDWTSGFFNRCLFVQGKKTHEQEDSPLVSPTIFDSHAGSLKSTMEAWKKSNEKRSTTIEVDGKKEEQWELFGISSEALAVGRKISTGADNPNLQGMLKRSRTHWTKIAAIEQVDEDPEAVEIGKAAAERALEFVLQWSCNVGVLVEDCFARGREEFEGDRYAKSIRRLLSRSPDRKFTASEILRACGLDLYRFTNAIDVLSRSDYLIMDADPETHEGTFQIRQSEPKKA